MFETEESIALMTCDVMLYYFLGQTLGEELMGHIQELVIGWRPPYRLCKYCQEYSRTPYVFKYYFGDYVTSLSCRNCGK